MSFITVEHSNPKVVTNRLQRWSHIFKNDLIVETIQKQMDITYEQIYKMAPRDTGYLRSTIKVTSGTDYAQIVVSARYAYYVHAGMPKGGRRVPNPFWKTPIVSLSFELIVSVRNLFMGNF